MEFDVREMWRVLQVELVGFAPRLLAALALLIAFWLTYRLLRPALHKLFGRAGIQTLLTHLIVDDLLRWAFFLVGAVMAIAQLGVNVGAALAGLSVAGIALGFAAQDTLANMVSGFVIFWDKPFIAGEWVTVAGEYGQVQEITLRSTRIRTNNNTWVVLPNRRIIDQVLVNHSRKGLLRLEIPIRIALEESAPRARAVILAALRGIDHVLEESEPDVVVAAVDAGGTELRVRVWIADAAKERPVHFAVTEAAKEALDRAGIEIPYQHQHLVLADVREPVWERLRSLRA